MEPIAYQQYVDATKNVVVKETGLHIKSITTSDDDDHHSNPILLGASPDGIVKERRSGKDSDDDHEYSYGLLEIKCLYGQRTKKKLKQYEYCPKRFYDQIQGQLAVCSADDFNVEWCDLIVWIPRNSKAKDQNYSIVRVYKNETYWNEKLLPEIKNFVTDVQTNVRNNKEKGEPK